MSNEQISIFSTGNGDSTLLESGDTVVLTDINYRTEAADQEIDDKPDFASEIRDACLNDCPSPLKLGHYF